MKGLLGIAIGLSLLTSLLVYHYLTNAGTMPPSESGNMVVVAKVDIPAKTKITAEMVQEVRVPAEYMQPGAIQDINTMLGVITRERIVAGEQIVERRLVLEGQPIGFTGLIPRDKRAVTVAVTEVTGVAGFVKPGDYVDVIATFDASVVGDSVSNLVLQNILVLAVDRDANLTPGDNKEVAKDAAGKGMTVTLAVTPDDASRLTLVEEKGKIRLALRPYLPLTGLSINNPVTPQELVGFHAAPLPVVPTNPGPTAPPASVPYSEPPAYYREPIPPASNVQQVTRDRNVIQLIKGTKTESLSVN
jgi:pilus assembly protein CpaB